MSLVTIRAAISHSPELKSLAGKALGTCTHSPMQSDLPPTIHLERERYWAKQSDDELDIRGVRISGRQGCLGRQMLRDRKQALEIFKGLFVQVFFSEAPQYLAPFREYYTLNLGDTSQGTSLLVLAGYYQHPSELGRILSHILQMWILRFQNPGVSFISQECSFLCLWWAPPAS